MIVLAPHNEVGLIWVVPVEKAMHLPYLREFACNIGGMRRPSMRRLAAYTQTKFKKEPRRMWKYDDGPYPAGCYCPREGVVPASLGVNVASQPAYPALLLAALARGETLAESDAAWLARWQRGEVTGL